MHIRVISVAAVFAALSFNVASRADPPDAQLDSRAPKRSDVRSPEMIVIPTTTFLMGSPVENERSKAHRPEEKPQHEVTVNEFAIGRFLVTADEFCRFLNAEGNHDYFHEKPGVIDWRTIKKVGDRYVPQQGAERCPAFPVTWLGADAYCKWLAKTLDKPFRLPSEAEWELTARGKELRAWPWGEEPPVVVDDSRPLVTLFHDSMREPLRVVYRDDPKYRQMPFYDFRGASFYGVPTDYSRPWLRPPVGSFPLNATPEGAYDMVGYHFGQWCADIYDEQAYSRPHQPKPDTLDDKEARRSLRGMYAVGLAPRMAKQDRVALRLVLQAGLAGDAAWDQDTLGRTWSRKGAHPTEDHGIFRLAMSKGSDAK